MYMPSSSGCVLNEKMVATLETVARDQGYDLRIADGYGRVTIQVSGSFNWHHYCDVILKDNGATEISWSSSGGGMAQDMIKALIVATAVEALLVSCSSR